MRISDWSSDVCSSDLLRTYEGARDVGLRDMDPSLLVTKTHYDGWKQWDRTWWVPVQPRLRQIAPLERLTWLDSEIDRSEESRVGKECVSTCRSRWSP